MQPEDGAAWDEIAARLQDRYYVEPRIAAFLAAMTAGKFPRAQRSLIDKELAERLEEFYGFPFRSDD